ncbi:glycosyltransferase family 4 protein [Paenibacillus sp. JX-17]|uniref:Glycosyltransferase family 4 protein n=1 Tax=Paenibacillus lacisoli TaxID=3064525 RepID=A0ABT9CGF8_9BACL|nr:glycosyltransferase family 4 protein [Paenibacillus sp. JX-17]MDO7907002.1 glycosyltransferase family 4 protein [Paenibacillus sp. JX-17]
MPETPGEPVKAAVITPGSFVIPSGMSSSVERMIENTVPLAAAQIQSRIYGIRGKGLPDHDSVHGVECVRVSPGASYGRRIIDHLKDWKPDVIDVHNRPRIAKMMAAAFQQSSVVLTLHSLTFVEPPYMSADKAGQLLDIPDRIVVDSDFLGGTLMKRYPFLQGRVESNLLGVRLQDFLPRWTPAAEALREAKLRDRGWQQRKIVMYAGRLLPEKGVHILLEALPELVRAEPQILLLIVGGAYYGSRQSTLYSRRLNQLAEQAPQHVMFIPFTPYTGMAQYYNLADLVVVPSLGNEAFGLVNVEAMASAVPVVASDAGGIPEVVKDGVTGRLIPKERLKELLPEIILQLLRDAGQRQAMGLAGREEARHRLRWEHTARRWEQLMQKAAGR